jgi:ferredoxin--NADP+ reductase
VAQAATTTLQKAAVPLELEQGEMPLNTYNNKKPFKGVIKSVKRIVGPNATGETCDIVIETKGDIPFWEGQSYGVIPPVSSLRSFSSVQCFSELQCNGAAY